MVWQDSQPSSLQKAMKYFIALLLATLLSIQAFAIPFTLRNNSLRAIPLEIPGVMNPNLSPISDSGVDLAEGQKIYFLHQGKTYLLLEVSEKYRGQILKVNKLIRQRKRNLGL